MYSARSLVMHNFIRKNGSYRIVKYFNKRGIMIHAKNFNELLLDLTLFSVRMCVVEH